MISDGQADDIELLLDGPVGAPLVSCSLNGETRILQVERCGPGWVLTHAGATLEILVLRPRAGELAALMPVKKPPDLSGFLLSPMPGLLVSISVAVGEEVKAGQQLAVVEAMKMENILRSEKDGTVLTLHAEPGSSLAVDQAILEFE